MNKRSIGGKINLSVMGISLFSLITASIIFFYLLQKSEATTYQELKEELQSLAYAKIESKSDIGLTNAISIANDRRIEQALINYDRDLAIESLKNISSKMKVNTNFKNIKVHVHTNDNKSFLRNWVPNKYADDLSGFRAAVVEVNKTGKPIVTFEVGKIGLNLRAVTNVRDIDSKQWGSLEFIQGLNSVAKAFDKHKSAFLLLMDESVAVVPINEEKKFKNFGISQKYINKSFLADAKKIDIEKLKQKGYLLGEKYFFTYVDIKDFQGKYLGVALLGKPLSIVNANIEDAKKIINTSLLIIVFMTLVIIFVSSFLIEKLVSTPLKTLKDGLDSFFLFLQNKKEHTEDINLTTNDEFGQMASSLNENITVSAKLHEEINELNHNLEEKVEEKTAKVKTLLDNAGQGFLTFDENFLIDEEYSKECELLLGKDLANKDITELLFKEQKKKEIFKSSLINASNVQKDIIKKSYLSLLPINIILNKRAIKLEYKILENKKFMLILTNITTQIKLERKMKKEQDIMQMVVAIVSESETFYETKKEYLNFLDSYENTIDKTKTPLHNISNIYRTIHTFKGSFAQLYMQDVVSFLHNIESEISKLSRDTNISNEQLLSLLDTYDFKENFESSLEIIEEVLGDEFIKSENYLKINYKDVINLQDKVTALLSDKKSSQECQDILCQIQNLSSQKLHTMIHPYISLTAQLAQRLEKEIYPLDIMGDEELIVSDKVKPFVKSLIHIFRNSVDHGIETPERRVELDKDEMGTILCSYKREDDKLYITISDDGAGISLDKIKEKLDEKGIEYEGFTNSEIYSFIFDDNFSTKDKITDISGRGVGMSAVKSELNKLKGDIKINSEVDKGTTLEFILPCGE